MKFLIASDLHGSADAVRALARRVDAESPDSILLLGDLLYHGPRNDLPEGYAPKEVIPILNEWKGRIVAVRGNCDAEVDEMVLDFPCRLDSMNVSADDHLFLLTHGHLDGLTPDEHPLLAPGSAFLSGHTHVKSLELREDGVLYLNPGSPSLPKDGVASYASYEDEAFTLRTLDGEPIEELGW